MADKTKILELDIDTDSIIARSVSLKTELDKARQSLVDLKKAGDTSSDTFVKQAATISKLTTEFNNNQKQLTNLVTVNGNYLTIEQKVNLALEKEIKTIDQATENNKELIKVRNTLNVNKEDEKKLIDEINRKLDENNDLIKNNVSGLEKQKIGIGDYVTGMKEAINQTGLFGGVLNDVSGVLTAMSGPLKMLKQGAGDAFNTIKNAAAETEGLTTAQKAQTIATNIGTGAMRLFAVAVAATGIGLIIIAIALLIGYFKTFDPLVDKIEQGMAALGAVIRFLQQTLVGFIGNLKSVGDLFTKLGAILKDPIGSMKSLGNEMARVAKEAALLKEAQQDLADQQAIQAVKNKEQEGQIARLILQSKDRSKTEQERIALLQQAEAINAKNFNQNAALAQKELDNAVESARIKGALSAQEVQNLRDKGIEYAFQLLNVGKITDEEIEMLTKAEEAKIDIFNRATAEQEKIINRQNALAEKAEAEAEARAKKEEERRQKILDDAVAKSQAELNLFLSLQGVKAKSLEESLRFNEEILAKNLEIAEKEFAASEKTEADKINLLAKSNEIKNDFLLSQNELVLENAQHELDAFIKLNKSKIDENKFLTEQMVAEERTRLELIANEQREFEALRLEKGQINQQAYNDAIDVINEEHKEKLKEIELAEETARLEKAALDLENKLVANQFDLDLQLQQLEAKRLADIKAAEKNGADVTAINAKYEKLKADLVQKEEFRKLSIVSSTLDSMKGLLKENTVAFKAIAVAQASMETYMNAVSAYQAGLSVGGPAGLILGPVSAGLAIAAGLKNVASIVGVKLKEGAIGLQGPGTTTSDSIPAMLSRGESVIKARSTATYAPLLRAINDSNGGPLGFANGMVPSTVINSFMPSAAKEAFDYDLLAAKIAEANLSLPVPQVWTAVTDINTGQDDYAQVMTGANF